MKISWNNFKSNPLKISCCDFSYFSLGVDTYPRLRITGLGGAGQISVNAGCFRIDDSHGRIIIIINIIISIMYTANGVFHEPGRQWLMFNDLYRILHRSFSPILHSVPVVYLDNVINIIVSVYWLIPSIAKRTAQ